MKKTLLIITFINIWILFFSAKIPKESKFLPVLFFKENSIKFDTLYSYYENTENIRDTNKVINFIVDLLKKNQEYKVTISGYSDVKEISPAIALYRAEKVAKLLIESGVAEIRIIIKSYGNTNPNITAKQIEKAPNEQSRQELRRLNRKVTFFITA